MSTLEDSRSEAILENVTDPRENNNSSVVTESMENSTVLGDQPDPTEKNIEPSVKSKTSSLRSYRQKAQALQARIKYREKAIKGFRHHLKKGTFPKRFKSLKPYPKMNSPDLQTVVNAACQRVECVVLGQMLVDEEKKLTQEQAEYQTLKELRLRERSQVVKTPREPKKMSVALLRLELADLQSKYAQLYEQLNA